MKFKKLSVICLSVFVLLSAVFLIYTCNYYHADENDILSAISSSAVEVIQDDDMMIFKPAHTDVGFIFYPGGKVEYTAYAPLMKEIADNNILCIILRVPFNLAVFDTDAADAAMALYPEITKWYLGGHSLGGVVASDYAHSHEDLINGVVLLGSYITADFSGSDLHFLSVYGSEDGVMNKTRYNKNYNKLPENTTEYIIEGGCHSYFGNYGMQSGDGVPSVSREEQIKITAELIAASIR